MVDVKGQTKPDDVPTKDLGKERQGSRVRPSWERPVPPVVEKVRTLGMVERNWCSYLIKIDLFQPNVSCGCRHCCPSFPATALTSTAFNCPIQRHFSDEARTL